MLTIEYVIIIKFVHNNANNWVSYYYKICPYQY
jgi:hypothetical protein